MSERLDGEESLVSGVKGIGGDGRRGGKSNIEIG
jgi:hypothetical protein